jgi:small subunit ribosomal protein S16
MLKIRLQRHGAKHAPFYRMVVTEVTAPRDGRFIEILGTYDPKCHAREDELKLKMERIDHWLGVGAQPTDTVRSLIRQGRLDPEAWLARAETKSQSKADRRLKGATSTPSMDDSTGDAPAVDSSPAAVDETAEAPAEDDAAADSAKEASPDEEPVAEDSSADSSEEEVTEESVSEDEPEAESAAAPAEDDAAADSPKGASAEDETAAEEESDGGGEEEKPKD